MVWDFYEYYRNLDNEGINLVWVDSKDWKCLYCYLMDK